MNASHFKILSAIVIVGAIILSATWESKAQTAPPSIQAVEQEIDETPKGMDPERVKIWNSPQMLKARAWMVDYCQHSARVSPEQTEEYLRELEKLTPVQMKLWLLKFEQEDEQRQQQYQAFQKAHHAALTHALAMQHAIQQSYADINRGETEAAQVEEGQLNQQRQQAAQLEESKMQELDTPGLEDSDLGGAYLGYGAYPGYGGWGGVHYHIHVHP